ncbi:MAG: biopolymer transporter ExbD [Candidatus Omnitrophota bacterium]|nr:MAG: biopolymer transporter ExbD [Candidatus Omnitrophota bacterium]
MRFKRGVEFEKGQLDIAPLIDVVFLLLIFFMLTSSYIFQPGIKINLPKAVTSEVIQEENLVITINARGVVSLNNRQLSLDQLRSHLEKAKKDNRPLLIKADRQASLGKVVQIWDMSREVGLTQINIATSEAGQ